MEPRRPLTLVRDGTPLERRLYREPPRNDLSTGERFLYGENLASRKPSPPAGAPALAGVISADILDPCPMS